MKEEDKEINVNVNTDEGIGCLMYAIAFAIVVFTLKYGC